MADVIEFHAGREAVIPVKAKKPSKRAIDKAPVSKVEYPELARALGQVETVNSDLRSMEMGISDLSRSFLSRVSELFSGLPPVSNEVWEQHFVGVLRPQINDKVKLSNIKVALIAISNMGAGCIGEHTNFQEFCRQARDVLKSKGLLPSGKGGRPTGHGTDKAEPRGDASETTSDGPSEPVVREAVSVSRKVAAAVLANPQGVHAMSKQFAHALHFACEDMERLTALVEFIRESWPEQAYPSD